MNSEAHRPRRRTAPVTVRAALGDDASDYLDVVYGSGHQVADGVLPEEYGALELDVAVEPAAQVGRHLDPEQTNRASPHGDAHEPRRDATTDAQGGNRSRAVPSTRPSTPCFRNSAIKASKIRGTRSSTIPTRNGRQCRTRSGQSRTSDLVEDIRTIR